MQTEVIWVNCHCYTWPIIPIFQCRPCGRCGEYPTNITDEPLNGKAGPLA